MNIYLHDKRFERMLGYKQIAKRIRLLSMQVNVDYKEKTPLFIGVLNGCFLFMADLLKEITIQAEVSFIRLSSYQGDASTGNVKTIFGLDKSIANRDVIIIEDIVDTGFTANFLLEEIKKENPSSLSICTLLMKPSALKTKIAATTYVGFNIPDTFVVGYGLDYNGLGRNLKDIYAEKS